MNLQLFIAVVIVLGALAYAGAVFWKKTRSFSPKTGCNNDCGCGGSADKLPKQV